MSETEITADSPCDVWLPHAHGMARLRLVPEQIEVVARRDGQVVLRKLVNGEEAWREVLTADAASLLTDAIRAQLGAPLLPVQQDRVGQGDGPDHRAVEEPRDRAAALAVGHHGHDHAHHPPQEQPFHRAPSSQAAPMLADAAHAAQPESTGAEAV